MCQNPDGSYTIPVAGDQFPVPNDNTTLHIIHTTMYHSEPMALVNLIVYAYRDINRLWLRFRKEMYAEYSEEVYTEDQYKTAMLYIVACTVYHDELDALIDFVERMEQEAW
jgi:hypothetical protein